MIHAAKVVVTYMDDRVAKYPAFIFMSKGANSWSSFGGQMMKFFFSVRMSCICLTQVKWARPSVPYDLRSCSWAISHVPHENIYSVSFPWNFLKVHKDGMIYFGSLCIMSYITSKYPRLLFSSMWYWSICYLIMKRYLLIDCFELSWMIEDRMNSTPCI